MTPTEMRLRLRAAGYSPIPLRGKNPGLKEGWAWQKLGDASDEQIIMWGKAFPDATNTGILTKSTPALDVDILHPEASEAIKAMIVERFEARGCVLVRIGQAPKFAVLFRTDAPFPKINRPLIAPHETEEKRRHQKLEFLGDGQQLVVHGVHPETGRPYRCHGGEPCEVEARDVPYITAAEAQQVVDAAAHILVEQFGYVEAGWDKRAGSGADQHAGEDPKADLVLIASALDAIPNTADWDGWNTMGMATWRATGGSAAGLALFDRWSQRSPKYDRGTTVQRWAHYFRSPPTQIGAGTIFHLANQHAPAWRDVQQADPEPEAPNEPSGESPTGDETVSLFGFSCKPRWHGEAAVVDDRPWLVEALLPEVGSGLAAGQWGTFKTFSVLDLAAAIMTGTAFIKFPVQRQGGVLFIACEGQTEVAIRISAAYEARGGTDKAPFVWIDNCPRLLDPKAAKILTGVVRAVSDAMMQRFNVPVVLVIIDPVARGAGYVKAGDENDSAIAKQVMGALATAAANTGTFFLAVAHFGKAPEVGTRGSSSYEDDADVVLALLGDRNQNGVVSDPRLCIRKRRSGSNGEEFRFRTVLRDMGTSQNGTSENTLTIEWLAQSEPVGTTQPKPDAWSKSLRLLRQTLMNVLADAGRDIRPFADGPVVRAVDLEVIRGQFYRGYPGAEGTDAKSKTAARQKAFARAITQAKNNELIGTWVIEGTTYVWLAAPTPAQGEMPL